MLRRIPKNVARTIDQKIKQLAENPYALNNNVTHLTGAPGYRLRVGDWRVIYKLHDDTQILEILKIGPRGGVYR